jgi:hypothetical protein
MGLMYKYCPNCKCQYPYNPSVGDLGIVCPYCGKLPVISAAKKLLEVISGKFT